MSTDINSRKPLLQDNTPTLAAVLTQFVADETQTVRRRRDTVSAFRTVARALAKPLDEVPADPAALRECLKGFAPSMLGLSSQRWANCLSLARGALKQAGMIHIPARSRVPFAPRWSALFRLVDKQAPRMALSRFARYCTTGGIEPETVDDSVLDSFLNDFTAGALVAKPQRIQRKTAVFWNRLAATLPEWPQQRLKVPSYSRNYALGWDCFPPSLLQDVEAYLDRQAGHDILDDFDRKPLRPASLKTIRHELSIYVSALVHRGRDPQSLRTLSDVIALHVLKDGLRFFLDRSDKQSTSQAFRIARRVRYVALHWVKTDATHLTALKALCQRLDPGRKGMSDKNRSRLRQLDDPKNVRRLLQLPATVEAKVVRCKTPGRAEALQLQAALAVEILLMVPLRRRNLANLNIDRHLIRSRGGGVHLAIPGQEVKNYADIEAILPPETVKLLDLYLDRYRPILLTQPSPWLFPGIADRPKSGMRLGEQISAIVLQHAGLLVNPHLFRHISAKLYLAAHQGAYGVIRLLHGHKSVETTAQFYCGTETAAAFQHFDAHISSLRADQADPV